MDKEATFALLSMSLFAISLALWGGSLIGQHKIKQQAFERGHMVECVGREGYYWSCEE